MSHYPATPSVKRVAKAFEEVADSRIPGYADPSTYLRGPGYLRDVKNTKSILHGLRDRAPKHVSGDAEKEELMEWCNDQISAFVRQITPTSPVEYYPLSQTS
jgi:hypothetical protein